MKKLTSLLTSALMLSICTTSFSQDTSTKGSERAAGQAQEAQKQTTPQTNPGTTTRGGAGANVAPSSPATTSPDTSPNGANQQQRDRSEVPDVTSSQNQAGHSDRQSEQHALSDYFAGKILLMNQSTIEMSEMAQQKASSQEVKDFAKRLADSHQQLSEKLEKQCPEIYQHVMDEKSETRLRHNAAYRGASPETTTRVEGDETRAETNRRERTEAREARKSTREQNATDRTEQALNETDTTHTNQNQNTQHVAKPISTILKVEQEATQNYQKSSVQMLEKYKGQDFDMGFLGFQIGAHTWSLAELKAIDSEKVGDKEFQRLISDATREMEQNLKEAQKLAQKHEDDRRGRNRSNDDSRSDDNPKRNDDSSQNIE